MPTKRSLLIALFGVVLSTALPAFSSVHEVPLMRAAGGSQQGFVRVEAFDAGGEVKIEAWDDSGHHAETTLTIQAGAIRNFNSSDLELGNASKGLPIGIGMPMAGDWRLRLSAGFGFDANSYMRTQDGFVTSLDSTLGAGRTRVSEISFFNPARNQRQRSWLRIINDNDGENEAASVTVAGVDDTGKQGTATFSISIPPLNAVSVDARDLEQRFGTGSGKWRLRVSSGRPVRIVNLLETPTGHLTSLEPAAGKGGCRISGPWGNRLPIGAGLGESLQELDRSGEDLASTDWRFADLGGADFKNSTLWYANFSFSSLRFANLSRADFSSSTQFFGADLTGADLSDTESGDFDQANLTSANLTRHSGGSFIAANLCNAVLDQKRGGNFARANLSGASAALANFYNSSFWNADMSSMYLVEANLESADLRLARLDGSDLTEAELERSDLRWASLVGINLFGASGEGIFFNSSNLSRSIAHNADFEGGRFGSAILYRTNLAFADLTQADLRSAILVRANLTDANLLEANLRGADLSRTNFTDASLRRADLREVVMAGTNLTNADLREANLTNVNLCDAKTQGVRIDLAEVSGAQCVPE